MKKIILLFTTLVCVLSSGCSSEIKDAEAYYGFSLKDKTSKITVRAPLFETVESSASDVKGQVVFTGDDILWFNETTKELRFKDNNAKKTVVSTHETLSFYIDDEYLFTASTYSSGANANYQTFSGLLFYYNSTENKYYLIDGNELASSDRESPLNASSETSEWSKFINQLKKEGRYNN